MYDDEDELNDSASEAGFGISFSDTLLQYLAIFMCFFTLLLLMPHEKAAKVSATQIGVMCVELSWPNDRNIDLDLWGHSPHDHDSVGYSNMHGQHLNLLRDIIGFSGNPTHMMLEVMCTDEMVPGEWIFNVHYFGNHEDGLKDVAFDDPRMAVEATMVARYNIVGKTAQTFMAKYNLTRGKQEKTMLRFIVKSDGSIDEDSVNSVDHRVRGGWKE